MSKPRKSLPDDITLPKNSIASREMYEQMYAFASDETEYQRLIQLSESPISLTKLWEETEYQSLIDAGLAVRKTGEGNPYVQITALGEAFVNHGPEGGLRELIQGEYEAEEYYSSDSTIENEV